MTETNHNSGNSEILGFRDVPQCPDSSVPYKNLHIYYIRGRVKPCNEISGRAFIGNWEEDNFSFLFFSETSGERVAKLLDTQPDLTLLDQFCMTYEEWQGGKIAAFEIGSFLISPPWERTPKSESEHRKSEILLDPGVVFGTGTHPTTHDCIEMLERVCCEENIESVLDLGTGTGLLALAAARLGCRHILALDFNFLAAKTAKKNVVLNGMEARVLTVQGRAENFMDYPADLMIANIHYDVMKQLIRSEGFLHKKKWFILSGLLRSEARDIAWKLSQHPVRILERRERDSVWHTFLGEVVNYE